MEKLVLPACIVLCAGSVSARNTGIYCFFADGANPVYEVENLRVAIGVDGGNPCREVANKFCDRTSDASDFMGIGFRSWKFARGATFFK
ncbi:hypothetical protein [Alistipes communis]|uniref:hypothetical protein n=1 Tax=Alistipes communis TaxID=2585118 RepID=UPI003FD7FD27